MSTKENHLNVTDEELAKITSLFLILFLVSKFFFSTTNSKTS